MITVFDLEATCWDNPEENLKYPMEIIQIGAVKISLAEKKIVEEFEVLIKPSFSRGLSTFCTELTGITDDMLKGAHAFPSVYPQFVEFCGSRNNNTLVAWGDYDGKQIRKDLVAHGMEWTLPDRYINASALYRELKGTKKVGLAKACKATGLEFEGTQHHALNDARMAARVFMSLFQ